MQPCLRGPLMHNKVIIFDKCCNLTAFLADNDNAGNSAFHVDQGLFLSPKISMCKVCNWKQKLHVAALYGTVKIEERALLEPK